MVGKSYQLLCYRYIWYTQPLLPRWRGCASTLIILYYDKSQSVVSGLIHLKMENDLDTQAIRNWRSILTLVVFILISE